MLSTTHTSRFRKLPRRLATVSTGEARTEVRLIAPRARAESRAAVPALQAPEAAIDDLDQATWEDAEWR